MVNKKSIFNRLYFLMFIVLLPEFAFGLYKNGYYLYKKDVLSGIEAIKPLILVLMSLCGSILGLIVKNLKKEKSIKNVIYKNRVVLLEAMMLSYLMPISSSPIIIFILTFIMSSVFKKLSINRVACFYLVMDLINRGLGLSTFKNLYELSTTLNYDAFDMFIGFNRGGICSTSIILILISLIILSFNKLYKKSLSVTAILTFSLLVIVKGIIRSQYTSIFSNLFSYNIMFVFVFVLPSLYSSSYTEKGQVLSGVVTGLITFLLLGICPYSSSLLGVLATSLTKKILDKPFAHY